MLKRGLRLAVIPPKFEGQDIRDREIVKLEQKYIT